MLPGNYSHRICGPMKISKLTTAPIESNSVPYGCEANALPYDHGRKYVQVLRNGKLES